MTEREKLLTAHKILNYIIKKRDELGDRTRCPVGKYRTIELAEYLGEDSESIVQKTHEATDILLRLKVESKYEMIACIFTLVDINNEYFSVWFNNQLRWVAVSELLKEYKSEFVQNKFSIALTDESVELLKEFDNVAEDNVKEFLDKCKEDLNGKTEEEE